MELSKRPSFPKKNLIHYLSVVTSALARKKMRLVWRNWRILAQEAYYPMYHKLNLSKSFFPARLVIETTLPHLKWLNEGQHCDRGTGVVGLGVGHLGKVSWRR